MDRSANTEWTLTDFNNTLLNPFLAMLASRQLTNQIDYVILSMDIPYRVSDTPNGYSSTTSTLFYGFKPDSRDSGNMPTGRWFHPICTSAAREFFPATPPIIAASNSFLVTMITASNLDLAMQIVRQGVSSDSAFPTQPVVLVETTDTDRNVRYTAFDNAIFNTRLRGD